MCKIRNLRADEIECMPKMVYNNKVMLLLYKDARCDMKILDETFGVFGWQRKHEVINGNLFCTVSVKNPETDEWISKQDVGTESNTEKQKGEASDALKRACTNIGIGRELYSSPQIWIKLNADEIDMKKDKPSLKSSVKFYVSEINADEDKQITFLNIIDVDGNNRFSWSKANLKYHEIITGLRAEDAKKEEVPTQEIALPQEEELSEYLTDRDKTFIIDAFKKSIGKPKENAEIYKEILQKFGASTTEEIRREDFQKVIECIQSYSTAISA